MSAKTPDRKLEWWRRKRDELKALEERGPLPAKVCECHPPLTYEEEDGEKRCLCGRAVR